MKFIQGKYETAIVYTDNIEPTAEAQIKTLCDQPFAEGSGIRIMPDVHAGKGCTIGTTMKITDKIVPNLVGVDIGCGLLAQAIDVGLCDIDLEELDTIVSKTPSGFKVNKERQYVVDLRLEDLACYKSLEDINRIELAIGSLGSGNHYIEYGFSETIPNMGILTVHSGSRNLGKQVAEHYQNLAIQACSDVNVPKDLAYLTRGDGLYEAYLHDMQIVQRYATINRETIIFNIIDRLGVSDVMRNSIETIHNFIGSDNILRKGAIAAYEGEYVVIPMNMRDGMLVAVGRENPDWNYSAPHGAGRLMSRGEARRKLDMGDFTKSMEDIYTTSVLPATIDEAPMAYKPMKEIIENTKDTVEFYEMVRPVYNFKAH